MLRTIQYNKQRPPFIGMSATHLEASFSRRLSSRLERGVTFVPQDQKGLGAKYGA